MSLTSRSDLVRGFVVEVARKMKAIEGMQPQINDMERRIFLAKIGQK